MEKHIFWAFFMIALVAGVALGFSVNNTIIQGQAISSFNWLFSDSDGGLVVETQGFCQGSNGNFVDYCKSDLLLVEYIYNEETNRCSQVNWNCELGGLRACEFGACVNGKTEKDND